MTDNSGSPVVCASSARYTSSVEVLGLRWDLEGEDSSKTSSSMPSLMGFIFEEILVPGDFSEEKQNKSCFRCVACCNALLLVDWQPVS